MAGFRVVIPARYGASRLPGKVLHPLRGRPMLEWVWRAAAASGADQVVVATDDRRVAEAARAFGADVAMTAADHPSGTDRMAEVADRLEWGDSQVAVNLQGDEPLMPPTLIAQVAAALTARQDADVATACTPIEDTDAWYNPNVVKVVRDARGDALYFSRSPIPHERGETAGLPRCGAWRHIGLYAYRAGALRRFSAYPPCALERSEALEQLRAQWYGMRIHVVEAIALPGPGVDTPQDVQQVERLLPARD